MPHGRAFEELLDEQLASRVDAVRASARPGPAGTAAAYGFFLFDATSGRAVVTATYGARVARAGTDARGGAAEAVAASPRPCGDRTVDRAGANASACRLAGPDAPACISRRILSAREQQALDELLALGATLTADFSPHDLRSAFRTLAREYHPDRHVALSDEQRAGIARLFTRAHDAYRILAGSAR